MAPAQVGTIESQFDVSATGSAIYRVPLVVPPGIDGMAPQLSVAYDSTSSEASLGMGFSLGGFSTITRCPLTYARDETVRGVKYDNKDALCLDGVRLVKVGMTGIGPEYRTFPDQRIRVVAHLGSDGEQLSWFEVYDLDGTIRELGNSTDSLVLGKSDVAVTPPIVSWWISKRRDRHDNWIRYYYENSGYEGSSTLWQFFPTKIEYGGHGTGGATRRVAFDYETWSAHPRAWVAGKAFLRNKRVKTVRMLLIGPPETPVRSYVFTYGSNPTTSRAQLVQITECAPNAVCKPSTKLGWIAQTSGVVTKTPVTGILGEAYVVADVNGDGLEDLVYSNGQTSPLMTLVALSLGGGAFAPPTIWRQAPFTEGTPIDWNHDGRMDILTTEPNHKETYVAWVSQPNNTFASVTTTIPYDQYLRIDGTNQFGLVHTHRLHVADFNGDGLSDIAVCYDEHSTKFKINLPAWRIAWGTPTGTQQVRKVDESPDGTPAELIWAWCTMSVKFVDIDSDGKVDILGPDSGTDTYKLLQFTPSGRPGYNDPNDPTKYVVPGAWSAQATNIPGIDGQSSNESVYIDVNGDGNVDVVKRGSGGLETRINTGRGFEPPITAISGGEYLITDLRDARPVDWNGDGNMDVLVYIGLPMLGNWRVLVSSHSGAGQFTATDLTIADTDLVVTSLSGTSHSDLVVFNNNEVKAHVHGGLNGLLNTITDGMNVTDPSSPSVIPNVKIWYDPLVDVGRQKNLKGGSLDEDSARYVGDWSYDANDATYPRGVLVGPVPVVSQYGFHNGINATRWFDVRYRNGRYDALADGGLGFGAKITYAFDTDETNVQIYDNETRWDHSYPLVGIPTHTLEWSPPLATQDDKDELVMSQSEYAYSFVSITPGTFLAAPTRIEDWRYEGIWGPAAGDSRLLHVADQMHPGTQTSHTRVDYVTRDAFANATKEIQTTYGADTTTITRQFSNDAATWLIARPTIVSTKSEANGETQIVDESTTYTANGEPWVVTRSVPNDATASRSTTLAYDDYGNVVKTSLAAYGADSRIACTTYDSAGLYAIASKNPYEHTTYARHDPGTGVVTAVRDANGLDTRHEIDGFGRMTRTLHMDGTVSNVERSLVTNAGPSASWRAQKVRTYRAGSADTTVFYDMLGRTIRTETKGPDVEACEMGVCTPSPRYAEVNEYDKLGNLYRASRPFLTAAPASQITYEVTDFDILGRPWRTVTPWNKTINYAYERNQKTVTTSEGDVVTQLDGGGRIAAVRDRKGGLTKYTYGPFGNPRTIDAIGSVTSITTDALGRSTVVVDPDRGESTVTYNGFDEPTERIDALGRSVKYKFDLLGRRTDVIAGEGTSTWKYDPAGCKGCLDRSDTSAGVSRVFAYDALTRAKSSTLSVGGVGYTVTTSYDAWSRPSIITYPTVGPVAGARVKLHYSTNGRVLKVTDDVATTTYFDAKRFDGTGNLTKSTLGTGITVERTYDHNSGALDALKSSTGAIAIQNLAYEQDDRLNMKWRQDLKAGQQEHFEYDVLDRLWCQKWNRESPGCIVEVKYDDNGNIRSKSDFGTYTYDPGHPHAVSVAGPRFYLYDAVGNQTRRPGIDQIDYTSFDLPSRYHLAAGGDITFDYDAEGNRVRKTTATERKTYLGDMYERVEVGSSDQHRYYVPVGDAQLVITKAAAQSTTMHYSLPDGMGSAEVIVSPNGGLVERRSYDAWGARRELTWANPPVASYTFSVTEASFTGHEQDDEVGLVNMKGRIYDPKLARFVQPDPHTQSPFFSQVWNRYSYALNNPLRYTDPTGFDAIDGTSSGDEGERPSITSLPPIGMDPMRPTGAPKIARSPVIGDQATPLSELPPPTEADSNNRFASVPGETTSPFAPDEANGIANDTSHQNENAQSSNDGIGGLGLALMVTVSTGAAKAGTGVGIGLVLGALTSPIGLAVVGGLVVGGVIGFSIPLTSDEYPNKTHADSQSALSALTSGGLALEIARKAMRASGFGSIYVVPAPFTKRKTHNYVGRNNTPFPSIFRSSTDGRDRRKAVTVRYYDLNNPQEGKRLEQVFINRHGGLRCTDNDRDEIREELWPTYRVPPPLPGCWDWLKGVPGAPAR